MRALLKRMLFELGAARLLHRLRNRSALSVVMFHRVVPASDPRARGANPTYTVSPEEFAICLDFFARWYSVIDLEALRRAKDGAQLPPCPLLITFDDGWRDNHDYALAALQARRMPAVLFVATDFIGDEGGFWQERAFAQAIAQGAGPGGADARVRELAALGRGAREAALAAAGGQPAERAMADADELRRMQAAGVAMGGHGQTHEPLTSVADAPAELRTCREALAAAGLGGEAPAFSFPHGQFSEALIDAAHAAGFSVCFTSAPHLTPLAVLGPIRHIGRVSIELGWLRRPGGFDLPGLAFALLTRPHTRG